MNKDQQEAIDKARTAAINLKKQADKAHSLGLTVLEQWLRDASVGCMAGADFQTRAMGDNLATQTERVVMDGKPGTASACPGFLATTDNPVICQHCGSHRGNHPGAQADVIAETILRRHKFMDGGRWDVCLKEGCAKGSADPIHNERG